MDKKKIGFIGLSLFLLVITLASSSYAIFKLTVAGTKNYKLTIGTLDFEIQNEANAIRLNNAYPMSDTEGQALNPYTFTLTNTGTITMYYKISLVEDEEAKAACTVDCNYLAMDKLKFELKEDGTTVAGPALLSDTGNVLVRDSIAADGTTKNFELRLWLDEAATIEEVNKRYFGKIKVEASQDAPTFASLLADQALTPTETMFNYNSEGVDSSGGESVEPTNGIYVLDDDDGPSYFYRGVVDNLVQFGEYQQDYYVYRYVSGDTTYDFASLEACQEYAKTYDADTGTYSYDCDESNKVVKYTAGTPMYWRIIRVNGDGTIRMIYAGTTKDATLYDTGIGVSEYSNGMSRDTTGYTYNRTTTEVETTAKKAIDQWYATYIGTTEYDSYVANGKFCSDSSGYQIIYESYGFRSYRKNFSNTDKFASNGEPSTPTFKCPETTETFGGSYTLKAGLITIDEVNAAGGRIDNPSYYLYSGSYGVYSWTMTPMTHGPGGLKGGIISATGAIDRSSPDVAHLLRPVINLKANVSFQSGTDGSTATPFQIVK